MIRTVELGALRAFVTVARPSSFSRAAKHLGVSPSALSQTIIGLEERVGTSRMDSATRKVLSWRVSNTMDVEFCLEALEEALERLGRPQIFNTDRRSQFTSPRFNGVPREAGVRISRDRRGRWMDNVFIERLWRSLKYECVYLHAFETDSELRTGLSHWIGYYNAPRPHSTLAGRTPDEAYEASGMEKLAA